jgi:hypothetical protein
MSAATPIWKVASWPVGTRCDVWARANKCPANAMAQAIVRRSPEPMLTKRFCGDVPAGVVRRRSPEKARRAPIAVVQCGGGVFAERSAGTMVKRGTKTTTRPVMKADFAGVV